MSFIGIKRARLRIALSFAVATSLVLGAMGSLVLVDSASADGGGVLDVSLSVSDATVQPGDSFVYTMTVGCSIEDCVDTTLVDTIPSAFDDLTIDPTVSVTGTDNDGKPIASASSWSGRTLTVRFTSPLEAGGQGLPAGASPSIQVTLTVPDGLAPERVGNGVAVQNQATVSSPTAPSKQASAGVTVTVPYSVKTTAGIKWDADSAQFRVGAHSTVTLTTQNTSNAFAQSLAIGEPEAAASTNVFDWFDFASFGAVVFPAGADRVRVDACVDVCTTEGDSGWQSGDTGTSPALPNGVLPANVTNLRIVFTSSSGATLTPGGSAGSVPVVLAQRATLRSTPATSLIQGATATDAMSGTVTVPGQPPVTARKSATYGIGALTVAVGASLVFEGEHSPDARIAAGTTASATMSGENDSNGVLSTLTLKGPANFFTQDVLFQGFRSSGAKWPTGATGAKATWVLDDGSTLVSPTFGATDGLPATPTLPAGRYVAGFSVTYTGDEAGISTASNGGIAIVPFIVGVSADAVPSGSIDLHPAVEADGHNDAGDATPATATATLTVLAPTVFISLDQDITPTAAIPPGGRSTVQLTGTTGTDSGYVKPTTITIIDQLDTSATHDFWSAFDAVAIAPTAVSLGSTLTVSYTTDGSTWIDLPAASGVFSAITYSTALPSPAGIIGLKFVFSNPNGFAKGSVVEPSISFQARTTLRGSTDPVAVEGVQTQYTNSTTALVEGEVGLGVPVPVVKSASASSTSVAIVKTLTPSGPGGGSGGTGGSGGSGGTGGAGGTGLGGVMFDKSWLASGTTTDVPAQSGQSRTARLEWGAEVSGYDGAVVSDPADATVPVAQTVFEAFDLLRIQPISPATDPLIAYDEVTKVELYNGTTHLWSPVSSCTPATPCVGQFPGFDLTTTPGLVASTTGVRLTFAEYADGRTADALAPPVGSGIASGPAERPIDLVFQLRNSLRDGTATSWITRTSVLGNGAGSVLNTAHLALSTPADGTAEQDASDAIQIVTSLPQLGSTNATGNTTMTVPHLGDVDSTGYPTSSFTATATNTSAARAWYLRVTDPMPCTTTTVLDCVHDSDTTTKGYTVAPYDGYTYDPIANPFERFTITKVGITLTANSGIDLAASKVTLLRLDNGVLSTSVVAANSSTLTNASNLADVVGVSALFTGTSTAGGGTIASGAVATIKLSTALRQNLRSSDSTPLTTTPATVTNSEFSQIWDDVLDDHGRYDSESVDVHLLDAVVKDDATETLSTSSILETQRGTPLTVTLKGTANGSTASTQNVTVEDSDTAFWDSFQLQSLGTVKLPQGANRVRVDYQLAGSSTWVQGTAAATAGLPGGLDLPSVTGIRFVFTKSDGTVFSTSASSSAVAWDTSVALVVGVRTALRSSGNPVPFTSNVDNTFSVTSTHDGMTPAVATAKKTVKLDAGTFTIDVQKKPAVTTTPAGQSVDFSLIVTDTGTGYIDNPVVVDTLPADGSLLYDPTVEATYTSSLGTLSTSTVAVAYNAAARTVTFSWPAGARLAPTEKYTIVLPLQVAPGLKANTAAINTMTVRSDRALSACTNTAGTQPVVFTSGATSCVTTNQVTTVSASALSSFKGVKGDVDASGASTSGAVNTNNAATPCAADAEGFYRSPCAANSSVGGTDLWKLQFTNGGNIDSTSASLVDLLPTKGDSFLRSTSSKRLSDYAPVFAGDVQVQKDALSAGATFTWFVTTSSNPCPSYDTNPDCSGWVDGPGFDPSKYGTVRAIKVVFDFSGLAGGVLPPTSTLKVTYTTKNTPSTKANDGLAPVGVPVTNARAWNSFAVHASFAEGQPDRNVEPVKAGVQLATGPIQVTKVIDGPAKNFAPVSYSVTVACTVDGAAISLPNGGKLTLDASSTIPYVGRIDGIPVGADCRVTEDAGSGPSSVAYTPLAATGSPAAEVTVETAGDSTAAVPAGQQATVTNTYGYSSLTVTKAVTKDTTVGSFGPFGFTLGCTVDNGKATLPVVLPAADSAFTLADGESHLIDTIPVNAVCALAETDSKQASTISVSVDDGTPATVAQGQAKNIAIAAGAAHTALVTNHYAGGQLAVTKTVVTGSNTSYGAGPFTIQAVCSYGGATLFTGTVQVVGGETKTFAPVFPVGTSCAVTETTTGGATSTSQTDATVAIPAPAGGKTLGLVTVGVTNTFAEGSLDIVKAVTGDGAAAYGTGPFQATVACTWQKDGTTLTIPLPDSGVVDLTTANGFSGTVTGLIAGADCEVTETVTGAATVSQKPVAADPIPAAGSSTVHLSNEFDTGSLVIVKDKTGTASSIQRFGDGPFTVAVVCGYLKNGAQVPIDLGADATQALDAANGYTATIDKLLVGSSCTVTETDPGLAVSSSRNPVNGTVTIVDKGEADQATVHVINHFETGQLKIVKTASSHLVQGLTSYDYTLAVSNPGTVSARGVTVTDPLDPTLKLTNIVAPGWKNCGQTGEDPDGFGGTMSCDLDGDLGAGVSAPVITITVTVLETIAQDQIPNVASVKSTNPIVDGDSDSDDSAVLVKWLDVKANAVCIKDAPWLDYTVDAHNVDVTGHTMKVNWADKTGVAVHEDDIALTQNGTITGALLWPGAAVNSDGAGIAWPGYRDALPGETPDWEGLVLDPTLPSYSLRDNPQVTISINPHDTFTIGYPPSSPSCELSRDPNLTFSKTASVRDIDPGDKFHYTMKVANAGLGSSSEVTLLDHVPASLHIIAVTPTAAKAGQPSWRSCDLTDVASDGFGGTITCVLDRPLNYNESAPDVLLYVEVSKKIPAGMITNTAGVTGVDPDLGSLPTLALHDTANVATGGFLAYTGVFVAPWILAGVSSLVLGLLLTSWMLFGTVMARRKPRH